MKFIRRLLVLVFLCVLCAGGYLGYKGYVKYEDALNNMGLAQKAEEIKSRQSYTPLEELPKVYLDAVVAVEDKRFYKHPGFDIMGVCRAVKNNIQAGALKEGGSTITQQLAKNLYFEQDQNAVRKIAEGFMALTLEKEYSKEEILELYVNCIYFGDGYYCVADASRGYFGKEPADMSDYESTMLAGIPNAPSVYAPTNNPDLAKSRQGRVLESMVNQGYLTRGEADAITNN